jgi:hypothetical protein
MGAPSQEVPPGASPLEVAAPSIPVARSHFVRVGSHQTSRNYCPQGMIGSFPTQSGGDALAGNAPALVDCRDGSVHFTGTKRPVEEYVRRYLERDPNDDSSWHP